MSAPWVEALVHFDDGSDQVLTLWDQPQRGRPLDTVEYVDGDWIVADVQLPGAPADPYEVSVRPGP